MIYRNSEGYTAHSFRDKQSWNVGGIYNCVLEFSFLLARKLLKVMEGEIVGKMMFCVLLFFFLTLPWIPSIRFPLRQPSSISAGHDSTEGLTECNIIYMVVPGSAHWETRERGSSLWQPVVLSALPLSRTSVAGAAAASHRPALHSKHEVLWGGSVQRIFFWVIEIDFGVVCCRFVM